VPRRGEQGPKTIDQIHKDAEQEEHMQQVKVQQQLMSRNDGGGRGGGGGGRDGRGGDRGGRDQAGRGGQQVGRGSQPQDEGWNTVPISTKNRPIDTSRLSKITKVRGEFLNVVLSECFAWMSCWLDFLYFIRHVLSIVLPSQDSLRWISFWYFTSALLTF
jgi:hypothetical protein